jgi:hypothetical protein
MRPTIKEHSGEWGDTLAQLLVANGYDSQKALGQLGAEIAGQIRESIIAVTDPPLAASTIRRKGFDKPLVESGNMLNSVDFEVDAP